MKWTLGLLGILLVLQPSLNASLVITVYRDQAVYVASDSAVTSFDGKYLHNANKTLRLGDTCLACCTGPFELTVTNSLTGKAIAFSPLLTVENLCRDLSSAAHPFAAKRDRIVGEIGRQHRDWVEKALGACQVPPEHLNALDPFKLQFIGFDPASSAFLSCVYSFHSTNATSFHTNFYFGPNQHGFGVGFQGEVNFLSALVFRRDPELAKLCRKELRKNLQELCLPTSRIPEQRLAQCLLEMFRLHKEHAARLGFDKGRIGEPYVIYKITKDRITQIRPARSKGTNRAKATAAISGQGESDQSSLPSP